MLSRFNQNKSIYRIQRRVVHSTGATGKQNHRGFGFIFFFPRKVCFGRSRKTQKRVLMTNQIKCHQTKNTNREDKKIVKVFCTFHGRPSTRNDDKIMQEYV